MRDRLQSFLKVLCLGLSLIASALPAWSAEKVEAVTIRVGSKIDTEGALLGNMILVLLKQNGFETESRLQIGPTAIVRQALLSNQIDVYPEYTGNAGFFFNLQDDPVWRDGAAGYEKARDLDFQKNGLVWLPAAPANNTWAIAMRRDEASKNTISTLQDFARWIKEGAIVKLAGSAEFVESPAALPAFQKAYGFNLSANQLLVLSGGDTAATIKAAAEKTSGVNAAMAYGTDGALAALDLIVLQDPKSVQPVYRPAPVFRAAVLEANPTIKEALQPAFESLTLETLQSLNAKVVVDGKDAATVAHDYLQQKGFLK